MLIGYARISSDDQNLDLQRDALKAAGCEKIFEDKISGIKSERPGLENLKMMIRPGDTVLVWRLDRLGRSLRDLIDWVNYFHEHGVFFKSLNESIDTTSATGKLIFHIFAALAEFERSLSRERVQAGIVAARARGKSGGRPKTLSIEQVKELKRLYDSQQVPVKQICKIMEISKPTFYSYLKS